MKHDQQGATLIVVLLVLLLITIVGTFAIRKSMTSLNLLSNQQINTLLIQSSDAAFLKFQNPNDVATHAAATGIVSFLRNPANQDKELVFCFSGAQPFALNNAGWMRQSGSVEKLATGGGACTANHHSDGRSQVTTQVYIRRVATAPTEPFADIARGTDFVSAKTESSLRLEMSVISVMNGLISDPDDLFKAPNGCFHRSLVGANHVMQCLKDKDVLYNAQVAEYRFLSDFEPAGSQP